MAERTEEATPRRKHEAREKGQIARTPELNTAALLLVAFMLFSNSGPSLVGLLQGIMRDSFTHLRLPDFTVDTAGMYLSGFTWRTVSLLAPLIGALMLTGIIASLAQVGFFLSLHPLQPNFSRLNPFTGVSRMFSTHALIELIKSTVKVGIIGWVVYQAIQERIPVISAFGQMDVHASMNQLAGLSVEIGQKTGALVLVLAAVDYLVQRRRMDSELKMTYQELREEMRESEGSPQVKQRMRQRMRQLARRRMMQDVPKADVVITNPTHVAVALKYDPKKMAAPRLLAKGERLLAQHIKELARQHHIPIVENPPLARAINKGVEVGMEIPAGLYQAVAAVLAFVYRLSEQRRAVRA
ncbi:MAG: flagellar biosynthesis protein FlhB [Chloroflexi bacterium]|nr:flagellar biosynthesis protein FlhB [Chloroflexota bacterium]